MGGLRLVARYSDVFGFHRRRTGHERLRAGTARGWERDPRAVRGGGVRVEDLRAGRQGLCERHTVGRGLVLRAPRRGTRREAAGLNGGLLLLVLLDGPERPFPALAKQGQVRLVVL